MIGRVINGCKVYPVEQIEAVIPANDISIGMITVPADAAQDIADRLVYAGIRGILNFAPIPLKTPMNVYVEDLDVTMFLEKVAYFTRHNINKETSSDE